MTDKLPKLGFSALFVLGWRGGGEKSEAGTNPPVRGLRAYKVAEKAESRVRRFPSVLQPADVSGLSFEIGGQLKAVTLTVGQKAQLGDVLAEIDPRSLQTQVDQASAGVQQAQAQADNAGAEFQRKEELLKRGRIIAVGGVRDNRLVVTEGIAAGDLLASAGVSYLSDGQKVNLLPLELPLREAILAASAKRLRPILLTSATTVLGLTPMAIAGGALWHPMAILMMSGLAIASLLTLFFVPAGYFLLFRIDKA